MVRTILSLIVSLLFVSPLSSQNITLLAEDFNDGNSTFSLNTGSVGADSGTNQWIVNDEFIGTPIYSNTLPQDSVVLGTINGAPFSSYMHIHDASAAATDDIANANFNPDSVSDRFAELTDPICTKSLDSVTVSFYHLVEGGENAFGEIYFRKDGGDWTQLGPTKLYDNSIWQLMEFTDSRMNNAENLEFGFRWVNTGNSDSASASLSIDEFIISANYDANENPVEITSEPVTDTGCRGKSIQVEFSLSDTLCEGIYQFELSDPGGDFHDPEFLGTLTWQPGSPTTVNINVPIAVGISDTAVCYKIRVTRSSPQPVIVGETPTECFYLEDCPPTITTNVVPPTFGSPGPGEPDTICTDTLKPCECNDHYTLCAGSLIDIYFNSNGTIYELNSYVGVIGTDIDTINDSTLVLVDPDTINSQLDPNEYPAMPPGVVSGIIPFETEPGCNYYIQVNSTAPQGYGTIYGPFCVDKCDIVTGQGVNETISNVQACVPYEDVGEGFETTLPFTINYWHDSIDYFQGNEFQIQLLDKQSFQVVNTGGLGVKEGTESDSITISVPSLDSLLAMGILPGSYYMRVISTLNNSCGDSLGTLVNFTVGLVRSEPPEALTEDTLVCLHTLVDLEVDPYDTQYESTYEWFIEGNPDTVDVGRSPTFSVRANAPGEYFVHVREINNGCISEWSPPASTTIRPTPQAEIQSPTTACVGDTVFLEADFHQETYYRWNIGDAGNLIQGSEQELIGNNEAVVVMDSVGNQAMTLNVRNTCGGDNSPIPITVHDYPETDAGGDTTVCIGEPVEVTGKPDSMPEYFWLRNNSIVSTDSTLSTTVNADRSYILFVENEGGCGSRDTVNFFAAHPPEPTMDSVQVCEGDTAKVGTDYKDAEHSWNTGDASDSITTLEEGTYSVTVTNTGEPCPVRKNYEVGFYTCEATFDVPNAFSPNGDGLNDKFTVVGEYFDILELRIYNRWGELIFRTTDIEEGWNGEFRGKPVDPGVYTYAVKYEDDFGEVSTETGNVTLIR